MELWKEAEKVVVLGVEMYGFGLYVAVGALFAAITMGIISWAREMKPGTTPLLMLLSMLIGAICSRLAFCLMNQEIGRMMPLESWIQVTGGGWSMFGLLGGVFLAAVLCAKITHQETGSLTDLACISFLPFLAAERMGERLIPDFDISRPLESAFLKGSFLAVGDEFDSCLRTYYLAAAFAFVLFVVLVIRLPKGEAPGTLTIVFLLLFGAGEIVLESLRYDRFLSITFVGLQQVLAAVTLLIGVLLAVRRNGGRNRGLARAALISVPVMIGAVLGLEFALDRTVVNKFLLYAGMIVAVACPVVLSLRLLRHQEGKDSMARE
jgi:prolipoprotein diacylglyceryltransferase